MGVRYCVCAWYCLCTANNLCMVLLFVGLQVRACALVCFSRSIIACDVHDCCVCQVVIELFKATQHISLYNIAARVCWWILAYNRCACVTIALFHNFATHYYGNYALGAILWLASSDCTCLIKAPMLSYSHVMLSEYIHIYILHNQMHYTLWCCVCKWLAVWTPLESTAIIMNRAHTDGTPLHYPRLFCVRA